MQFQIGYAMDLRAQLIGFEGWRNTAYPDPLTHADPWTIGVGATGPDVVKGLVWTDEQISRRLDSDIAEKMSQCRRSFEWFDRLNEPRQAVVLNMAFQMGMERLLGFHDTLAAIRDERYAHAAECMRQSRWARQTPKRAVRLAHQLETGAWQ